ncbi:hypothetical protein DFQ28_002512 [Apophysomyces sp. BC1034]|nr:hypothetical protein DFQ30_002892 [Apophysomyces sp. BC1015]KAG0179639.1 hypothetical protein DFQ29_001840 [Apophysomyces sp. BC1021]KAG0190070.1 hypothetical protein DFQ28_002512 [Apophysomyces sp. BC1034]
MVRILPVVGLLATVAVALTSAAPSPAPIANTNVNELASLDIQVLSPDVIVEQQPELEKRGKHHKKDKKKKDKKKKDKKNKDKKKKDKKKKDKDHDKDHDKDSDKDSDKDHGKGSSGSGSSGSGSGKTYSGTATWFKPVSEGGPQGACGPMENDESLIVALNRPQYGNMSKKSKWCGKKIRVTGPKGSMTVTVNDACPGCSHGDLDLTPRVFKEVVGDMVKGVGKITWYEV